MSPNPCIVTGSGRASYGPYPSPPAWLRPLVPGAEEAWAEYLATLAEADRLAAERAAVRREHLKGRDPRSLTTAEREAFDADVKVADARLYRNTRPSRRALEAYDALMRGASLDPEVVRSAAARECLAQHAKAADAAKALAEALRARAEAYAWTGQPAGLMPYLDARILRDLAFVTNLLTDVALVVDKFAVGAVEAVAEGGEAR